MFETNNRSYYREREQKERSLAATATDSTAKAIHEELAARYHGLAIAAEFAAPREAPQQMVTG